MPVVPHKTGGRNVNCLLKTSGLTGKIATHEVPGEQAISILQRNKHLGKSGQMEDAFRNLLILLDHQTASAAAASPLEPKTGLY